MIKSNYGYHWAYLSILIISNAEPILLLTGIFFINSFCNQSVVEIQPPNVLFIAVDDLRPEIACYGAGHMHTPNIDLLASHGTLFENAYYNIPVCGASRASILTGLRPTYTRFKNFFTRADEDAPYYDATKVI